MGRARSRRRRGKTGGQGSGGSGTGGSGGSRGRSSNNRGGQGSGGSGKGKGTGGSKGRSTANRTVKKNRLKVKAEKTKQENKQKRVDRRNERLKKQFGLDYNDMKDSFRIKINPTQWLGGFTEKTGIPTGVISRNLPGFIKNMKIDHQLKSPNKVAVHPSDSKWGGGVAKDILLATQAKQAQKAQIKAEEKALDKQYKQDQAIYNNNKKNMSVTIGPSTGSGSGPQQSDKDWLKGAYKKAFGQDREANFDAKGGAQYWLDQMSSNPTSHSRENVMNMLTGSDEGKKFAASGVTMPGGVDPSKSIHSQFGGDNTWLNHWAPGGSLAPDNIDNTFTDVNKSLSTINPNATYTNFDDNTFKPGPGSGPGLGQNPKIDGPLPKDGWWTKFADADAFKKFLQPDQKSDGMGDFMKFMMLMNVMRPGGGGGYGGGGSQFGYGGLNPGGVQAAYDPMKQLQGMGTWFKDNFGSGSGTTSDNLNVGKV